MEGYDRYLRPTDAFIWYLEGDPRLRWTIGGVFVLERAPAFADVVERFERASRLDTRFRSRLAEPPFRLAPPRWVADDAFDLHYHLRHVTAAPPGDLDAVLELACATAMGGLDHSRPLWQATLVEGMAGGQAALVVKLNHALTDGIGGLQIARHIFDLEPSPAGDVAPVPEPPREHVDGRTILEQAARHDAAAVASAAGGLLRAVPSAVRDFVRDPVGRVRSALRTTGSVLRAIRPITDTKSPVMRERSMSWRYAVLDVPAQALYDAGHAAGGTLNDAFVAGVTGGLRRYHERHGAVPDELRVSLPISIRKPDDPPGGNRVIVVRYEVPVAVADPAERIRLLHERTAEARNEPAVPLAEVVFGALAPFTPWVVAPLALHMDFAASNVPGFRDPVYLAGARVERIYPFGPTGGTAVNVTLMSYRDTCGIGVNMDTAAIPDGDAFLSCLALGFDEVLDLAGAHAPARVGGGRAA